MPVRNHAGISPSVLQSDSSSLPVIKSDDLVIENGDIVIKFDDSN